MAGNFIHYAKAVIDADYYLNQRIVPAMAGVAAAHGVYKWAAGTTPQKLPTQNMSGGKKRVRTEQGSVVSPQGSFSFAGGVTKNTEELGGITATGNITGGNSAAPLTIKVLNGGQKWLDKFVDRRTDKFEKFFSPYWFYTYLRPNIVEELLQDNTVAPGIVEQGQNVKEYFDYTVSKIPQMAYMTPAVAQNLTTSASSSSGFQGIHNAMNGWANANSDSIFKVPIMQKRMTFRNVSNRRLKLKVYEFTCIQNCDTAICGVLNLWQEYLDRIDVALADKDKCDNYDLTVGGVAGMKPLGRKTYSSLGTSPICKEVNEYWKCTGKLNAYMLPGRNIEWISTRTGLSINRLSYDNYLATGDTAIAGWTTCYIVIAHGDTTAGYNSAVVPELSAKSDYKVVWTTDDQFVTNYTYKEPTVKHYTTSSLVTDTLLGIPHTQVGQAYQRGVALSEAALPAAYKDEEFLYHL